MIKTTIKMIIITSILAITLLQAQAGDIQLAKFNSSNIISTDKMELSLDNNTIQNITLVKEYDTLYIDSNFFTTYFGMDFQKKGYPVNYGGTVKNDSGKEILCLPLIDILKSLNVRYTYSPLYGKEILRIRTDGQFKIYKVSNYQPSNDSHGNIPCSETSSYNTGTCTTSKLNTNNLYTGNVYSTGICSSGSYSGGCGYPPGYGYYFPPGYQPGYYFGDYGFIPQGNQSLPQPQYQPSSGMNPVVPALPSVVGPLPGVTGGR
ncbi:MAG TPA: hypothetical protein PL110_19390 [Candidatus Eremiobacteraeota bacterium]|nr:MAG: hypothetical protein BWY64_01553 [bacterium ADurb.Bin363]HPZ10263.1 hypothetical protein [Candidatus Eremiobacteraeota bacterium]